ncbi:MAG: FAD-dependent oxidoreductase [bacterium]|nr:FAD-dependent oxidoreductase [bacterium]
MRVAIVGGGVNGLYLAWKLSEKNHQVTVFEKKKQIGENVVCSGLFSQRILDFIPQSKNLIKNRINHVLIHFPKKTIRVDFSKEFFVMDHGQLDQLTASLAQKSGAKLFLDQNIVQMPEGFDRIIGCDGANSFIRRSLSLKEPKYKLGVLNIVEGQGSKDFVEVWPAKTGFFWRIPRGENIEEGAIKSLDFLKELPKKEIKKGEQAKVIPQGLIIPNHSSITLCGDAAGLTKPWSGGGVIWGLFAADILLKTFPDFKKYRKSVRRFFIPKIIISKLGTKLIYFVGFRTPWLLPKRAGIESDFLV